jgi:RNA polymerase sigma-70 factor (ECF subfamily)
MPPKVGNNSFLELIRRVRVGDQAAATELVRRYEAAVRRVVRVQLRDPRLRRILDSLDISQAVLASFFVRAASGQYHLDRPEQLFQLLVMMARNKLASQARQPYVVRRVTQFFDPGSAGPAEVVAPGPGPGQHADWRDLLQEVRHRLSDEERRLADCRAQSQTWEDIAAELGGSPEALRKKLARALDRVSHQLGLDDLNHG